MIGEIIINAFLVTLMLTIAFFIINTRKVISTILLAGTYSLVAALMFVSLDAVDVAFTEASVGAGISTILFLAALSYLPKEETEERFNIKHIYAICICTLVAGLLIWASYDLPLVGQLENPVHQHLAQDFIEGSRNHIGIPNVVTSILASYRGFDTFGETVVIYTAGIAVLVLLHDTVSNSSQKNPRKNK
ncbi:DUF4040 domain-containing protein [bacterium]|nr:DUF4040 domain-containing protein [bacterium]